MRFALDRTPDGRLSTLGRVERLEAEVQILFVLLVIVGLLAVFT